MDDTKQKGSPIPADNALTDDFTHDYEVGLALEEAGLPYRSFFEGRYEGLDYAMQSSVQWVDGPALLAAFDADNYNIFHWGTTVLPAFAARIRELGDSGSSGDERRRQLLEGWQGGFSSAWLRFTKPTNWQWALAEVALGNRSCTQYVLAAELAAR